MGDKRPGDNLYTTSTIALDVATGAIKGHFQYHPNDSWDWDEVSPPILVDYQRNGRTVKGLIDVARDGYLWFLERSSGPIKFVEGKPYVYQNVFKSLDPITGRPEVDPTSKPGTGKQRAYLSRRPRRQELAADRVQSQDAHDLHSGQQQPVRPDHRRAGGRTHRAGNFGGVDGLRQRRSCRAPITSAKCRRGTSTRASSVWTHNYAKSPELGIDARDRGRAGVQRRDLDRKLHAFDAATGKLLWESAALNSGAIAPPTTFLIDGKQYLAVESGWGGDVTGTQAALNRLVPGDYPPVPTGGAVYVFAVE